MKAYWLHFDVNKCTEVKCTWKRHCKGREERWKYTDVY
jgi:hypothetical protein